MLRIVSNLFSIGNIATLRQCNQFKTKMPCDVKKQIRRKKHGKQNKDCRWRKNDEI